MSLTYKKQIAVTFLIIAIFSICSLLIVYSFFDKDKNDYNLNVTSLGNGVDIHLLNELPMSDALGKKLVGTGTKNGVQGYLEFSVTNENDLDLNYDIILVKQTSEKEINGSYINLYLTDKDNNPVNGFEKNIVPSYKSLKVSKSDPKDKVLYSTSIRAHETQNFRLRVWLDESSPLEVDSKEFKFFISTRVS